jgi:hypothetical protein
MSVVLTNFYAAASPPPVINGFQITGNNLVIAGTSGGSGVNCYVLATTNLLLPMTNWPIIATQQFNAGGVVLFTNPLGTNVAQSFYRLRSP